MKCGAIRGMSGATPNGVKRGFNTPDNYATKNPPQGYWCGSGQWSSFCERRNNLYQGDKLILEILGVLHTHAVSAT